MSGREAKMPETEGGLSLASGHPASAAKAPPIRAIIVDRNALFRSGLRAELASIDGVAVVSETSGGPFAIEVSRKFEIDFAIVGVPGDGVEVVDFVLSLKQARQKMKVLCGCDERLYRDATHLVRAGVAGIVPRDASAEEFVQAVRAILRGHSYLPQALTARLARSDLASISGDMAGLTGRELEVLHYITEGYSNKDIARRMDLSVRTVECHRLNLRRKSGMLRQKDLVSFARRIGLKSDEADLESVGAPGEIRTSIRPA